MKTLKMMLTLTITTALCVSLLSGCQQSGVGSGGDETTTTTAAVTTTTTEAVTTTTEAPTTTVITTTTAPAVVYTVNEEPFSELGKTFAEIKEKHGEVTAIWYHNGGPIMELADGSGKYSLENGFEDFEGGYSAGRAILSFPRGDRGEYLADPIPQPKSDAVIDSIWGLKATDLFIGLDEHVTAEQLADMYNITHVESQKINDEYICSFTLNEFLIIIVTESDYIITPDTIVQRIVKA